MMQLTILVFFLASTFFLGTTQCCDDASGNSPQGNNVAPRQNSISPNSPYYPVFPFYLSAPGVGVNPGVGFNTGPGNRGKRDLENSVKTEERGHYDEETSKNTESEKQKENSSSKKSVRTEKKKEETQQEKSKDECSCCGQKIESKSNRREKNYKGKGDKKY